MLFLLGALRVEVAPFNVSEVSDTGSTDYAVKAVAGAEQPLEFVGEGANELTLGGQLFPHTLGGMDELDILREMRVSGKPQYLMRGDGKPLGWFAITGVQSSHTFLDGRGIGRQVNVSINLRRAQTPGATSFFSLMASLLPR